MKCVDIHILQTVPPSNLNRDDTGSPKTAIYGGVQRARVSSQAWKRATRKAFDERIDRSDLGVRTKRVVELVAEEIVRQEPGIDLDRAATLAKKVLDAAGIKLTTPKPKKGAEPGLDESGYLLFLARHQVERLAELAITAGEEGIIDKKQARTAADSAQSVDVALFGRMVADAADLNVDAAAQVAHALSVHTTRNEFDYFTAVDDRKENDEETGAGMIGTVEFNSSTLYRYATVNIDGLRVNLGDDAATVRAAQEFVRAFITSMPTGKQNTFANRTLPDAVVVQIRDSQPINLVGAFEEPVEVVAGGSRLRKAADQLVTHAQWVDTAYGTAPTRSMAVLASPAVEALSALGETVSLDELIAGVGESVAEALATNAVLA